MHHAKFFKPSLAIKLAMSSSISISGTLPEVTVNVVPFRIQHSGPANTNAYFTPSKCEETVGGRVEKTAQFRGLRLVGEEVLLGDKKGYILSGSELLVPSAEEDGEFSTVNQYVAQALFDLLHVYGHDSVAPLTSQWKLANEWDAVANVLHS